MKPPAVPHPLVRVVGGRRCLYLAPHHMTHVEELERDEGRQLIAELSAWATSRRFGYAHRWQPGGATSAFRFLHLQQAPD